MAINQLFIKKLELELVLKLLSLLDIKSFDDKRLFSIHSIQKKLHMLLPILNDIKQYYIQCKSSYFNEITPKKIITILRQCLKLYNYTLYTKEIYLKESKTKKLYYYVDILQNMENESRLNYMYDINNKQYTLNFN